MMRSVFNCLVLGLGIAVVAYLPIRGIQWVDQNFFVLPDNLTQEAFAGLLIAEVALGWWTWQWFRKRRHKA